VKYIAPFVSLIHSVDSLNLLKEINKQAIKNERIIDCLLQIHIAQEETKFGLSFEEAEDLLASTDVQNMENIRLLGLMGMASNTQDTNTVHQEFRNLKVFYDRICNQNPHFHILSMGMSGDYTIALEEGSTLIRVGSALFGNRHYTKN
ncbi:MAG TPA: YggS family pyridoxal phosphate-dependent enzyme, partial [Cytophagales bacterium]|nr:YggS family pyridoxal phosphate-dependent enzyme [Cytophagales bacterium]